MYQKMYEKALTLRQLVWQVGEYNSQTGEYSIVFGTKEGVYLTGTGKSTQECFLDVIREYDKTMRSKSVPQAPISKTSDKLVVTDKNPQIDEKNNPYFLYNHIKSKLENNKDNVTPDEANFFLDYFKDHIKEDDFELASAAQNIVGNKNPS